MTSESYESANNSLLALHAVAGTVPPSPLESLAIRQGDALAAVAEAPLDDVPIGARLDVLRALAKEGLPGYQKFSAEYGSLAASIGRPYGVAPDQVIADAKQGAVDPAGFAASATAKSLPHEAVAFAMGDVCNTARVEVDGKEAAWVFSEFETDAPFRDVAEWIDPVNWPQRGPLMFKRMDPVGGQPRPLPSGPGSRSFTGVYHEEVQLVERLNTLLTCDLLEVTDRYAGMTYELNHSLDGQINVDRGFLLVNDLGETRHVKALKIVGFTEGVWTEVAQYVCPFWTDFVRGAARGGTASTPRPQTPQPSPGAPPDVLADWLDFLEATIDDYLDMATDWTDSALSGQYGADQMIQDGATYWLKLARDWSRASALAYSTLEKLAGGAAVAPELGDVLAPVIRAAGAQSAALVGGSAATGAGAVPPLGSEVEGTTVPVIGLDPDESLSCGDLTLVSDTPQVIPGSAVRVSARPLTDDASGVEIHTITTRYQPGLYVGEVTIGVGGAARKQPVQLYVSRARPRPTP